MFETILSFIRGYYDKPLEPIALHEPLFIGNERIYVLEAIDSTFVSSVGQYVNRVEQMFCDYTGASHAVAVVNGTAALHMSMLVAGVKTGDLVITQPLTFVATCNAISYLGAEPLFIDNDRRTLGLSSEKLGAYLKEETIVRNGECFHRKSNKRISACVPMHSFGHPVNLSEIMEICSRHSISLIEDAAESIGSLYRGKHTGTFGLLGAFSLNGNKTITCGGGGIIVTNNQRLAKMAKHLTTQAKVAHAWEFVHDAVGYNFRMPNLNAAMACAQMEQLDRLLVAKRDLAEKYKSMICTLGLEFVDEPPETRSNFWLNSILFENLQKRNEFLEFSNSRRVMSRPAWQLMNRLAMFANCLHGDLSTAEYLADRLVNLPSSPKV